ncbi:MAG: hypothetical protein OEU50_21095 [Gammaproteobacteria bacterium]|nr:hypothetical protein [Gammaproteobacteria bacterium]
MQTVDDLSEQAKIAYQAFVDMSQSKAVYFNCLKAIDSKYQSGGSPSSSENLELENLLARHDKNVLAFTTAMAAVTDSSETETLMQLMS